VQQRVFQIAYGYADQNDTPTSHDDALLKLARGALPERGPALARQTTPPRLESACDRRAAERLATVLPVLAVRERGSWHPCAHPA
jgi:hypothetical protein